MSSAEMAAGVKTSPSGDVPMGGPATPPLFQDGADRPPCERVVEAGDLVSSTSRLVTWQVKKVTNSSTWNQQVKVNRMDGVFTASTTKKQLWQPASITLRRPLNGTDPR